MTKLCFFLSLACIGSILNCVAVMQDVYWRDYKHGDIPYDAIEGAAGKYVGQVYYQGHGVLPATIYPHRDAVVALYGSRLMLKENIKILCSPVPKKLHWAYVDFNKTNEGEMKDAVKGGFQEGYNLFIGLTKHEDEYKFGKVIDIDNFDLKGLYVWDRNGKKVRVLGFHVLKYNQTTPESDEYAIYKT